jgi:tRNA (Thr-GGU) A37 N-methylase
VRLLSVQGLVLHINDIDIIDETTLLDIKPYVPASDVRDAPEIGWLKGIIEKLHRTTDDGRFAGGMKDGKSTDT